jgi:hypothetical protein
VETSWGAAPHEFAADELENILVTIAQEFLGGGTFAFAKDCMRLLQACVRLRESVEAVLSLACGCGSRSQCCTTLLGYGVQRRNLLMSAFQGAQTLLSSLSEPVVCRLGFLKAFQAFGGDTP